MTSPADATTHISRHINVKDQVLDFIEIRRVEGGIWAPSVLADMKKHAKKLCSSIPRDHTALLQEDNTECDICNGSNKAKLYLDAIVELGLQEFISAMPN